MSRKDNILEVAASLFAQKGFSATSTSAIAKEAGVAEGLIFHYFNTKKDILLHILKEMTSSYLEGSRANTKNSTTGLEALKTLINFHFEFGSDNLNALVVLIRDLPSSFVQKGEEFCEAINQDMEAVISVWKSCIQKGIEDNSISKDIPPRETALMVQGMLQGVDRLHLLGPIEVPEMQRHIIDFCLRAVTKD